MFHVSINDRGEPAEINPSLSCLARGFSSGCRIYLNGYNTLVPKQEIKPLEWVGSAKKDLLAMPGVVVDLVGYALHLAQTGLKHPQTKVLKGFRIGGRIGSGRRR